MGLKARRRFCRMLPVSLWFVCSMAVVAKAEYRNEFIQGGAHKTSVLNYVIASQPDTLSPAGKSFDHYYKYAGVVAGGGLIMAFDKDLNRLSQKKYFHGRAAGSFFNAVEDLGTETPYIVAVPLFLGHGLIWKKDRSLKTAGELVASLGIGQGITWTIKKAFGRKRPYESSSPYRFFKGGTSFYSGHTITAFMFATVVAKNYPRQDLEFMGIDRDIPVVPIISYTAAGMVGIQRLYANVHWGSDVYFGTLAGYAVGSIMVHFGNKIHIYSMTVTTGETKTVAVVFRF